jgi:hypothetical protein
VYNCCAGSLNNITMLELVEVGRRMAPAMPLNDMLWNIGGSLTTSKIKHYIKVSSPPSWIIHHSRFILYMDYGSFFF